MGKMKSEIYARGPVATGVNAEPIVQYTGGRIDDTKIWHMLVNHVVSIVGWETDHETVMSIGLSGTLGANIGEKWDTFESWLAITLSVLSLKLHGLLLEFLQCIIFLVMRMVEIVSRVRS